MGTVYAKALWHRELGELRGRPSWITERPVWCGEGRLHRAASVDQQQGSSGAEMGAPMDFEVRVWGVGEPGLHFAEVAVAAGWL